MTDDEYQEAPGRILHFPTVLAAIVPVYNLAGVTTELKFDAPLLASIYLGPGAKLERSGDCQAESWRPVASDRHQPPSTGPTVRGRRSSSRTICPRPFPSGKGSSEPTRTLNLGRRPIPGQRSLRPRHEDAEPSGQCRRRRATSRRRRRRADRRRDRLCRAGLRGEKQHRHRIGDELEGEFVRATAESIAGPAPRSGIRTLDARLPHLDHQRAGPGVYPISSFTWILLYERRRDLRHAGDGGLHELGSDRGPEVRAAAWLRARCLRR